MTLHYRFPESTALNRRLPKDALYQRLNPSSALRQLFINQVQEIIWRNKLSADTMNIGTGGDYSELHVFDIELKNGVAELDEQVLRAIDSLIVFPVLHRLTRKVGHNEQVQYHLAYKAPTRESAEKIKVGRYFSSDWLAQPEQHNLHDLPIVLNVTQLYRQLLQPLLPIQLRADESIDECMNRVEELNKQQRQINKLQNQLLREKQFNRKIELNRELSVLRQRLQMLKITNE